MVCWSLPALPGAWLPVDGLQGQGMTCAIETRHLTTVVRLTWIVHEVSQWANVQRPPERLHWAWFSIPGREPRRPSHDRLSPATDLQFLSA